MISSFIALLLSIAWLGYAAYYMDKNVGIENLQALLPNEQAMIVAGLCAPLALIWIIVTRISNGLKLRRVRLEVRSLRSLVARVAPPAAAGGKAQPAAAPKASAAKAPATSSEDVQKVLAAIEKITTAAKAREPGQAAAAAPAPSAPAAKPVAAAAPAAPVPAQPAVAAGAKEPNLSVVKGTGSAEQPKARAASGLGSASLGQMETLVGTTKCDLNALANDLVFGLCSEQDHADALSAYNSGQKDAFFAVLWEHLRRSSRDQMAKAVQDSGVGDLVTAYRQKFEDLAKEVQGRDSSGQALQAIRRQPMGRVYDALRDRLG